jgi:hypothetical protein
MFKPIKILAIVPFAGRKRRSARSALGAYKRNESRRYARAHAQLLNAAPGDG